MAMGRNARRGYAERWANNHIDSPPNDGAELLDILVRYHGFVVGIEALHEMLETWESDPTVMEIAFAERPDLHQKLVDWVNSER